MKMHRVPFFVLAAALALSCRSVPPAAQPAAAPPPPPSPPRRVVLLSLDGADADTLHRLYAEGALTAGGFARFFREGQVADRLVPVDPTLTSTNHISLATGYTAERTGIVSNLFHPAGSPFLELKSGFAAEIGTETLWEAARRQGRRVAVATWPGVDGAGPRRRADWGMFYSEEPDRRSDLVTVESGLWEEADDVAEAQKITSHSPVLRILVQAGSGGGRSQSFDLLAVDSTNDGKVDYDSLAVIPPGGKDAVALKTGEWKDLPCQLAVPDGAPRNAVCPVKLLAIAPDLDTTRIYFGAVYPLRAYPDDFAAALASQGLVWPGPPDDRRLSDTWAGKPGIDLATWSEQSDRFARFFGDTLVAAAQRPGWDLLMSYIPVIDEAGHQLELTDPRQAGYSDERRDALAAARRHVWQSVDRELARLLATVDLQTTVVALVSDHGMSPVHTQVDANVLLREKGLLAADARGKIVADGTLAQAVGSGGVIHVYLAPGHEDLAPTLRELFAGWRVGAAPGEAPVERVLTRQEAAAPEVGLASPNSGDLILFLNEGYMSGNGLREGKAAFPSTALGMHGYLNTHPDLHGIYMVLGAGIAAGNAGTVRNPEVAGRVAGWLGIEKPRPTPNPAP
jgi:predicted AlkP superfamily pyrophosphatase or phosphodiesterase